MGHQSHGPGGIKDSWSGPAESWSRGYQGFMEWASRVMVQGVSRIHGVGHQSHGPGGIKDSWNGPAESLDRQSHRAKRIIGKNEWLGDTKSWAEEGMVQEVTKQEAEVLAGEAESQRKGCHRAGRVTGQGESQGRESHRVGRVMGQGQSQDRDSHRAERIKMQGESWDRESHGAEGAIRDKRSIGKYSSPISPSICHAN